MVKSKPNKKLEKHFQRLKRSTATISPAPGQPGQRVSLFDALRHADNSRKAGKYDTAIHVCDQLENLSAAATDAALIKLQIAIERDDNRSLKTLLASLKAPPLDPFGIEVMARALRLSNQHGRCIQLLNRGIREFPGNPRLWQMRGVVHGDVADTDAAIKDLRRSLRLDPQAFTAYRYLANFGDLMDDDMEYLDNADVPEHLRTDVDASLAVAHRHRNNRALEMRYLERANERQAKAFSWRAADDEAKTREVISIFDNSFFSRAIAVKNSERRPIFVVGMPRSGSTLIEQILSQHESIAACGETKIVIGLIDELAARHADQYPAFVPKMGADDFAWLAAEYLDAIRDTFTEAKIFVDKQLENHYFVGLLAVAMPQARFIHSDRNAKDTCLSCYQQVFSTVPYANSFEKLAAKYKNKAILMAHWKKLLGNRIHTVVYEDLVEAPEEAARALLEFCGLEWEPAVLKFSDSSRSVRTASAQQVRQGIYSAAVEKWCDYEPYLGALISALDAD